mmetsp:Transcript_4055/g.6691  ORF Transcript_4055/g.6691 Transcript_4055/m.6691 type:complete len:86 (+) Transcript_4055:210-467(+)
MLNFISRIEICPGHKNLVTSDVVHIISLSATLPSLDFWVADPSTICCITVGRRIPTSRQNQLRLDPSTITATSFLLKKSGVITGS